MVTVIIPCWKRFKSLQRIIDVWKQEPEVDEIIIWDNSNSVDLKDVILIRSSKNYCGSKYAVANLAKNDWIINCDDDTLPKKGITKDFLDNYKDEGLYGVRGRRFKGSYGNSVILNGQQVSKVEKVDLCFGYLTLIRKELLLGLDYSNFNKYNTELCLVGEAKLNCYVIPTNKFEVLPEAKDKNAMYLDPASGKAKGELFAKYFG